MTKPCDSNPGLPCAFKYSSGEVYCLGRPYWEGKSFDKRNPEEEVKKVKACQFEEKVWEFIQKKARAKAREAGVSQEF